MNACALRRAAFLLLLARAAHGQKTALDSVVPPSPAREGFIADGGPVLDAAARARLNGRIAEVQRATGGDVGVAIVRDLHGRAPVDVGVAIYRAWRIGHVDSIGAAGRALGALLLIVPKELAPDHRGECWITTGRGAEGELTDARAGSLCRDSVIPHLRARDYVGAVAAGVEGIAATFAAATGTTTGTTSGTTGAASSESAAAPMTAVAPVEAPADGGPSGGLVAGAALLGLAGIGSAMGAVRAARRRRPRPCPRGHGPMVRLDEAADDASLSTGQQTEERLGSVDYDVWACPTCDERLVLAYGRWWSPITGCPRCGFRTVESETHTIRAATTTSTGLVQTRLVCASCGWGDVTTRETPRISTSSGSSGGSGGSSGGGGGGGGSSFGGSGSTAGGGGGSSY